MKQAFFALNRGGWEEFESIFKVQAEATEWAHERTQDAFEKLAKDEILFHKELYESRRQEAATCGYDASKDMEDFLQWEWLSRRG